MQLIDRLHGIFPPVVTNFGDDGEIAPIAFRDNLRRWMDTPVDGVVLFGSNGEGALLDEDEKTRLTAFAREVVPAGRLLIGGASGESTRSTIRQARQIAAQGADAVLVHPPAYFGPYVPVGGLMEHFRAVADASPVPVILYHIPKYTKVTLDPGFVAELARHENVVGMKDSSGDLKRFAEFSNVCERQCRLFIGNGSLLFTALELGAAGGIIGVANIAPGPCADIVRLVRDGMSVEAGQVQDRIAPLHREIVAAHGAVGCKAALDLLGWAGGAPRAPLQPLGAKERRHLERVMQEAGVL